jgi:hypothetical protein
MLGMRGKPGGSSLPACLTYAKGPVRFPVHDHPVRFPLVIQDSGHFERWPLIGPLTDYRAMPELEEPRAP